MIRAFSATDKTYITNGDAVIQPTKARVKNADNGDYTLELTCGSQYNDFIQPNNIIVVPTPAGAQPFRIREVTKKSNRLEVKAWHVFYDAVNYLIADSYAVDMTCKQALEHFNGATDNTSPFIVDSNVLKVDSYRCVRTSLLDCINTVLERWGGHLVRDGWNISILSSIGVDNGVTIQYKKNLQELTASYDWGNVCTKLLPVGKDGILLDELYLYSKNQYEIPYTKSVTFSQEIEKDDYPDEATYIQAVKDDLRRQGNEYLTTYSVPVINYTLKANPEKVTDIGDIIEVIDERIGVNVLTKVISYEYDCITERYTALEFGNFTNTLQGLIPAINSSINSKVDKSDVGQSVASLDANGKVPVSQLPTSQTVNNGKLTIKQNNEVIQEFTANQSTDVVAEITIPTKTSDLTNDSNYVSDDNYTHTDNNFTNQDKAIISGLGTASEKDYTTSVTQNSTDLVTSGAVWAVIDNLPEPMIFKGTLGTNGTITTLPTASSFNEGYTYKVITDGTYATIPAKVGDVFTSNGTEWVLIPSGDETVADTWRNININGTEVLGNGINTGVIDFVNGTGTTANFNATGNKLKFDVDTNNLTPTFTEASTRTNIASGETLSGIFGKIKKFFTDLKTVAFSGSYNDLTDTPNPYSLPTASASIKGGVKIGSNLTMNGEVLSATNTTTGTSYNAGSCPDNTTFATNGSVARVYSALISSFMNIYKNYNNFTPFTDIATKSQKIDGGYTIVDGICYVYGRFYLLTAFGAGAWQILSGMPKPLIATPLSLIADSVDGNTSKLLGARVNVNRACYILLSGTITSVGTNTTKYTIMGCYPVDTSS
jgi:phage minor structural protein